MTFSIYIPERTPKTERLLELTQSLCKQGDIERFEDPEKLNDYLKQPRGEKDIVLLYINLKDQLDQLEPYQWWRVDLFVVADTDDAKLIDEIARLSPRLAIGASEHEYKALEEILSLSLEQLDSQKLNHFTKPFAVNPKQGA